MLVFDQSFEVIVCGAGHAGCEAALAAARGQITPPRLHEIGIYEGAAHDHANDTALIMVFRKN